MTKKRIQRNAVKPGRGGARPNSGPKKGSKHSARALATKGIVDAALASGKKLPLDIMLAIMEYHWDVAEKIGATSDEALLTAKISAMDKAGNWAAQAAPYVHPRLQTTTLKNPNGEKFAVHIFDDIK